MGSYARQTPGPYSDVDIAVWSPQFSGFGLADLELYRPVLRQFARLDLRTYGAGTTANDVPFIVEIERMGIEIDLAEEKT